MALQIEFEATDADRGTLRVRGLPPVGSEVLVAVQRRVDDRYLTPHGRWDAAPSWYPCARLGDDDDAGVRFGVGAALTMGLRAATGDALLVHVRRRDFADCGPLEGLARAPQAVAPDRAATPQLEPDPAGGSATPDPAPDPTLADARRPADRPAGDAPAPGRPRPGAASPPPHAMRRAPLEAPESVGAAAALVAATPGGPGTADRALARGRTLGHWAAAALSIVSSAALLWWYLAAQTRAPVPPPTRPTPGPSAGALVGKALFLELKGQDLAPADLFGHAERVAQAGDCEAAIGLFIDAAKRDATLARRLGQRYDPADFQPRPCFAGPNPDSAQVWYQRAAEGGIPAAQRRYAQLLLAEADAGPVYQDAIAWLRKAAAAGDTQAADQLAALQQR
jgi:TPR repeat protein